jgi:uncharacterized protein (DUF488 family)
MEISKAYSIGFTGSNAERFFGRLRQHGIRRLMDVRINNTSQLSGFAKRQDLEFFLREILQAEYQHVPELAPTDELLKAYRNREIRWPEYERRFVELLRQRRVEQQFSPSDFETPTVLLCSEPTPLQCHRRLVLEYLALSWGGLEVLHL